MTMIVELGASAMSRVLLVSTDTNWLKLAENRVGITIPAANSLSIHRIPPNFGETHDRSQNTPPP
jgi:hypothetical protein